MKKRIMCASRHVYSSILIGGFVVASLPAVATAAIVPAGTSGDITVYASADISGYFAP